MKFGDFHEFKNFDDDYGKMEWWKGRLVKTKYNIRSSLFESMIIANTIGVVMSVYRTEAFGDALIVHWSTSQKSNQISLHDVYSSEH